MLEKARALVGRLAWGRAPDDAPPSLDAIALVGLDDKPFPAETIRGRVVLFVNVASRCGKTPQYAGLQALYASLRDRGFVIVGVPCNQFLGQEPGSAEDIERFCTERYGVEFPLLAKQDVNGKDRSPLYRWLIAQAGGGDVRWNFEKFLVGRDGRVAGRFGPGVPPESAELKAAIEAALQR